MQHVSPDDLFAWARKTDPDTSRAAARSVNANALEAGVVGALKSNPGGLTSFEIAQHLSLSHVSVSPRLRPLADRGVVEDSGERRCNPGSRAKSIVWRMRNA